MSIVEKHAGITLNNSHEEKLLRQIDKLTDQSELEQWVSSLEVMGNRHGDLQALIEYLTVHETYFYRDPQQFNGVREEVFPEIFKRKLSGQKKIKVWSAACSSGEEPYTLIILLLDELIKKSYASEKSGGIVTDWSIDVLGTDISSKIIQTASRGLYSGGPLGSFRGMPKALMRFFSEGEKNANNKLAFINYTVKPFVKKLARFKLFNLTSNRPPETGFDIVFCRNVMIYFNDDVKKQVQKTLYDALGPGGALVLGPTDILMIPELFTLHRRRGYTYYVKK
jgi:chemotaxis protein methyltransferase CheR